MKLCFRLLLVRLMALSVVNLCALAQSSSTLSGTLVDPSGAAVAGAEISAQRLSATREAPLRTTSGTEGHFVLSLAPGRYRVRVTHASFARIEQEIALTAGETRDLRWQLELERLAATVVVTAQAEPVPAESASAPVTIITREEIDRRQAISLGPLLGSLPGFSLSRLGREGSVTTLFLNGGNSNFTKVLVDGTTVNEPGGAMDFSNFTLDHVEKIEVVRGAESALFGSDAMAGVVQVFTHRGTTRRPQLTVLAEGGKYSTARGAAQFSGLTGWFDYSAAASRFETNGQGLNDRYRNTTLSGNFGFRLAGSHRLRLTVRSAASDAGIPGQTLLQPPNLDQHNALRNFSAHVSWEFATGPRWHHRLAGTESYIRQLFDNRLSDFFLSSDPFDLCNLPRSPQAVPSAFCDFPFTARNQFNRAGFAEQSSYLYPQGALTLGYQYEVESGFLSALGGGHARRNNQAGYLDWRVQPWRRLSASLGARAEANDSFGTRVVPRFGAAVTLRHGNGFWGATRLRGSFGLGIKEPRLDQSFGTDPCFPGNPALQPERSRTVHVGVEQLLAGDQVRISAGYFDNRFRDMVSFTFCFSGGPCPIAPPPGCPFGFGTFFNTDLARARGTNIEVEARPARWLRLSGQYSYDDTRVLKAPNAFDPATIEGNRLLRRPVHSGSIVVNAAFRRMNGNLAGYFTGPRTDSDFLGLGLTRNAGYARFDLAASYNLGRGVTAFGRIENLFDNKYQEAVGFPAYRRAYRLGMKFIVGGE